MQRALAKGRDACDTLAQHALLAWAEHPTVMSNADPRTNDTGFEFVYECVLETLPGRLQNAWQPLAFDAETEQFVKRVLHSRPSRPRYWLAAALRQFFSDFDVNGMLGLYPMHLLSTGHADALLAGAPHGSLLDIGAGNGDVTGCIAPLFAEVQTTEHSRAMVRSLHRRGYACERVAIADPLPEGVPALERHFDVVTCFNVIDRTSHPSRLLERAARRVSAQGALLLSVPLPLRPFYYDGPRTLDPEQQVDLQGATWEGQCSSLVDWLERLLPDFALWRLARCPYLSGGDLGKSLYTLDAAVIALRRTGRAANEELHDPR